MADLIDRSVALDVVDRVGDDFINDTESETERHIRVGYVLRFKQHLLNAPPVDPSFLSNAYTFFEEARAAGKRDAQETSAWEMVDSAEPRRYGCKKCKCLVWYESAYCPNCGRRMESER